MTIAIILFLAFVLLMVLAIVQDKLRLSEGQKELQDAVQRAVYKEEKPVEAPKRKRGRPRKNPVA